MGVKEGVKKEVKVGVKVGVKEGVKMGVKMLFCCCQHRVVYLKGERRPAHSASMTRQLVVGVAWRLEVVWRVGAEGVASVESQCVDAVDDELHAVAKKSVSDVVYYCVLPCGAQASIERQRGFLSCRHGIGAVEVGAVLVGIVSPAAAPHEEDVVRALVVNGVLFIEARVAGGQRHHRQYDN